METKIIKQKKTTPAINVVTIIILKDTRTNIIMFFTSVNANHSERSQNSRSLLNSYLKLFIIIFYTFNTSLHKFNFLISHVS